MSHIRATLDKEEQATVGFGLRLAARFWSLAEKIDPKHLGDFMGELANDWPVIKSQILAKDAKVAELTSQNASLASQLSDAQAALATAQAAALDAADQAVLPDIHSVADAERAANAAATATPTPPVIPAT